MMEEKDISERNGYLIALVNALDMGIHIVDLPHKPKLLNRDYKLWLSGYVKNFHLILNPAEFSDTPFADIRLRPIEKMGDIEALQDLFANWMVNHQHKRIYTVTDSETGLFLTGFNHHNKILKTNPYPVFARFDPMTYMQESKAQDVVDKFTQYKLKIN